ncbi:hypothetical protein D3C87_2012020 [compost metagenome]
MRSVFCSAAVTASPTGAPIRAGSALAIHIPLLLMISTLPASKGFICPITWETVSSVRSEVRMPMACSFLRMTTLTVVINTVLPPTV